MTMTLSRVTAMSISSASTPAAMAYANAGMVFSGRMARAPRWPCTRMRPWAPASATAPAANRTATMVFEMPHTLSGY